jgi:predicted phage-related endonuclease
MSAKYYYDLAQGTDEWLEARLGLITASRVKDLLTGTFKISKDKKIKMFAYELASQRINKRIEESYMSWDMERGHIEEGLARDMYEEKTGEKVKECGFITTDDLGFDFGFSPDGLVGDNGIIEIKGRQPKFQIQTFISGKVPSEYMLQCQTGLWASEREWCDFIQFSNGMPLFVKRVYPDYELMEVAKEAIGLFEETICEIVDGYKLATEGLFVPEWIEHADAEDII